MAFLRTFLGFGLLPSKSSGECPEIHPCEARACIDYIAATMRQEDRTEMRRMQGNGALHELLSSIRMSDIAMVGYANNGRPLSIFGGRIHNLMEGEAQLWSLSSESCNTHWIEFARASKKAVSVLMSAFPESDIFTNYIDLDYTRAVRWVKWMGATVSEDDVFTSRFGGRFAKFTFRGRDRF